MKLLKKTLTITALLLILNTAYGQIGINTNEPDESVVLEIFSDTKGLLIPRLETTVRLAYGNDNPANGVIVYDIQMSKFFVWQNKKGRWVYINPWYVDETTGIMTLSSSIANRVNIYGDLFLYGNVTVDGSFTGIINPDIVGDRILIKNGIVIEAEGGKNGKITVESHNPFTTNTNGLVAYVHNTNPNWTIEKDELHGNPNAFNVSPDTGTEGITGVTFVRTSNEYGQTKFLLKEGSNVLDSITMTAIETSGYFGEFTFDGCQHQESGFKIDIQVSYTRGIDGLENATIEKDLLYGYPDNVDIITPSEVGTGTTPVEILSVPYWDCQGHSGEETKINLKNGSQILDSFIFMIP